jgi:hypothetical protein
VLFGLPGVRLERVERRADGTRVVDAVTDEPAAAACASCGMVSRSVKERVVTSPKDIPYGDSRNRGALEQGSLVTPRRRPSTEVVDALSKGRVAPDGGIRGYVECNNCSGTDSTTRCSLHLFDRIYLVR